MSLGAQSPNITDSNSMSVSLVGSPGDPGSQPAPSAAMHGKRAVAVDDVSRMLRLIECVACARDRRKAVESIVQQIATYFPGANVRCGVGVKRLRKLYDRNLGWLGEESTLFGEAAEKWEKLKSAPPSKAEDEPTLVVSLPQLDGDGRSIVWIDGPNVTNVPHEWLIESLATLRIVFWDRPTRSWLRTPEKIGLESSSWFVLGLIFCAVLALWPIRYRVACTATVEPLQQRLVAAPFEATLLKSYIKPGDVVSQGDTLVELDGRPLRLELESTEAEIQQVEKEQNVALATGKIAESQLATIRIRKLNRTRDLLQSRLGQLEVVSPIDGVVVSGDLERFIGSPLELGQTVVEVSPLDRMAIELEIPEYEIGYVKDNADSRVKIPSLRSKSIRAPIDNVHPAAEIRNDRNVFIARLEIGNEDGQMRPGMSGEATIYGPPRPMVWSWARGSWEQLLWWIGY